MLTIPTHEPTALTAGTSWQWDRVVDGFTPGDGWALTYYFTGPASFSLAASPSDSNLGFEVREAAADHASRAAGSYSLVGLVTLDGETHQVYSGRVLVSANPATLTGDTRPFAERLLDAIEAALAGREIPEEEELTINGRHVKYASRETLYAERGRLQLEAIALSGNGMPLVIRQPVGFRRA